MLDQDDRCGPHGVPNCYLCLSNGSAMVSDRGNLRIYSQGQWGWILQSYIPAAWREGRWYQGKWVTVSTGRSWQEAQHWLTLDA